jgi:two-component system, cell cycle response regulator
LECPARAPVNGAVRLGKTILKLSVSVEPDRQRLARFAVEAVRALGGSEFSAAAVLVSLLETLRDAAAQADSTLDVFLCVQDADVCLQWAGEQHRLVRLPQAPPAGRLEQLESLMRKTSESADPDLLRRRNQKFAEDLERAKRRAAHEMAELEADLERKKRELQASIRKAEIDSLTGLLNRGAYDNRLHEAIKHCSRQREALCLVLLDLDFFKDINDTHGHQHGDQYLQNMAQVMRDSIREHVDIACRIGGDEFAIIAYSDAGTAEMIGERVLAGMNGKVSIGVTQLRDGDTPDTLVARADAALYDAKRSGRGRVCLADAGRTLMQAGNA